MAEGKANGKKGFAGLDSLVSKVDKIKPAAPVEPVRQPEPVTPAREPGQSSRQPIYAGKPVSGRGGTGKYWAIGIGVLALLVWLDDSKNSKPPPVTTAPAWATAPSPNYAPAPSHASASSYPAASSNREEIPPVGNGLVLNEAQIRYCLSEKIRVSAWKEGVNNYSQNSVDEFNTAVADYNARCSHFRYRSGSLESVRAQVEVNRYKIRSQGMASALANP